MEKILFICKFSITFPGFDADAPGRKDKIAVIYNHLVNCARLWFAQIDEDYKIEQPDYPDGLTNQYQRTDLIYLYRLLEKPSSIVHIAKLCEGYAGLLSLWIDADIQVDYPLELPAHCQPPYNLSEGDEYVPPTYLK